MLTALVIDTDRHNGESLVQFLKRYNYDSLAVVNLTEALNVLSSRATDVVFLVADSDLQYQYNVIDEINAKFTGVKVVLISSVNNVESAVNAMKHGAYDYLVKPLNLPKMVTIMEEIEQPAVIETSGDVLSERRKIGEFSFDLLAGNTEKMHRIIDEARLYASTDVLMLITGPSGVGKGALARAIHQESPRRNRPFVELNCSAIPQYLFDSELFGYEKGAFTDAFKSTKGLVEIANKGTLFLDEIADMPLDLQSKLLKVIEEKKYFRIGGDSEISVDVRFIAATNHDLEKRVEQKAFRDDLYYRLKKATIELPPLIDRKEDILPLTYFFISDFNKELGKNIKGISDDVEKAFLNYRWPGNIRELRNFIERMMITSQSDRLEKEDLPADLYGIAKRMTTDVELIPLRELEKRHIINTLRSVEGNKIRAAEILGIARSTLFEKIKALEIQEEEIYK